jgi:hypothetical protein
MGNDFNIDATSLTGHILSLSSNLNSITSTHQFTNFLIQSFKDVHELESFSGLQLDYINNVNQLKIKDCTMYEFRLIPEDEIEVDMTFKTVFLDTSDGPIVVTELVSERITNIALQLVTDWGWFKQVEQSLFKHSQSSNFFEIFYHNEADNYFAVQSKSNQYKLNKNIFYQLMFDLFDRKIKCFKVIELVKNNIKKNNAEILVAKVAEYKQGKFFYDIEDTTHTFILLWNSQISKKIMRNPDDIIGLNLRCFVRRHTKFFSDSDKATFYLEDDLYTFIQN